MFMLDLDLQQGPEQEIMGHFLSIPVQQKQMSPFCGVVPQRGK